MINPATFNLLRQFRAGMYQRFDKRADALFELLDAVTVAGLVPSLAYLSLPPVHRRRWGSLYDALAAGDIDAPALRELVARYPLDDGNPSLQWIRASGRATTRRPAQDAAAITPLLSSRPASRS